MREFERCVRVARRIVGQEEVARDIAGEAFVRAWARWPSLRDQRAGAWVARVTVNLAIDATRKRIPPLLAPHFGSALVGKTCGARRPRYVLADSVAGHVLPNQRWMRLAPNSALSAVGDCPLTKVTSTRATRSPPNSK